MSASLVGSEMCIRDRPRGTLGLIQTSLERAVGLRIAGLRVSGLQNAEPVSYTHLTLPTICSV
eukprot:8518202-Alexandrium_andersonii.AAC.1